MCRAAGGTPNRSVPQKDLYRISGFHYRKMLPSPLRLRAWTAPAPTVSKGDAPMSSTICCSSPVPRPAQYGWKYSIPYPWIRCCWLFHESDKEECSQNWSLPITGRTLKAHTICWRSYRRWRQKKEWRRPSPTSGGCSIRPWLAILGVCSNASLDPPKGLFTMPCPPIFR